MNTTKLTTAAAVSLALAGAGGIATAEITGVPGEANLGPLVLHDPAAPGLIETYIGLYVPTTLGSDTVTDLAAPNQLANGPTTQVGFDPRIHWTLFDENSVKVEDGICEVSPGDFVLWTTDEFVQDAQEIQRRGLLAAGIQDLPDPVCGPTNPDRFGYVVFQTIPGSDGDNADFAFWSVGAIIDTAGYLGVPGIASIPMMPMADSADPLPVGSGVPSIFNSVISGGRYLDGIPADPVKAAPILAGVRMNNSDAVDDVVRVQAPIQGPQSNFGMSLHVSWFDRNDPARVASAVIWDDHEGFCSDSFPMPRELNIWMFNKSTEVPGFPAPPPGWVNLTTGAYNADENDVTDVISAVKPDTLRGYNSSNYCFTPYWTDLPTLYEGALGGYVEYELAEINDPQPTFGIVNSAAVMFNLQQTTTIPAGWATHMSADLGKL